MPETVKNKSVDNSLGRVGKSGGGMLFFRLLGQAVTFVAFIVLGRYLKPELFGRYNYLYGLIVFFIAPLTPLLNDLTVREAVNRASERVKIFRVGNGLRLIFSLVGIGVALLIIPLISSVDRSLSFMMILFASGGILFSVWMPSWRYGLESMLQVDFRMDIASAVNLIGRVVILGFLLWGCFSGFGLTQIVGLQAAGELIATILLMLLCVKLGYPVIPSFERKELKFQFNEALPLIWAELLVLGYTRIDVVMLKFINGEASVGYFAAAMRLTDAFQLLAAVFIVSAMPILSRTYQEHRGKYLSITRLSYKIMTLSGLFIALSLSVYSSEIILLFYGGEYAESIGVLTVGAWSIPLIFGLSTYRTLLVASHKQHHLVGQFLLLVIICLVLNRLLIPEFGAVGAAWAKVATFATLFPLTLFWRDVRETGLEFIRVAGLPIALAVGFSVIVRYADLPILIGIPIMSVGLLSAAYFTGWFGRVEIKKVMTMLRSNGDGE